MEYVIKNIRFDFDVSADRNATLFALNTEDNFVPLDYARFQLLFCTK